jgi:hypothetical protein
MSSDIFVVRLSFQAKLSDCMRHQTMKVRLLLGLVLSGLLCSCASNSQYSETMIDTSTHAGQTVLPEPPPHEHLSAPIGQQDSGITLPHGF